MVLTGLHHWWKSKFKWSHNIALPFKLHSNLISDAFGPNWIASQACTRPCKLVHDIAKFGRKFKCVNNTSKFYKYGPSELIWEDPCAPALPPLFKPSQFKGKPDNFHLKIEFESHCLEIQKLQDPKLCSISKPLLQAPWVWSSKDWSKQDQVLHNIEGIFQKFSSLRFSLNSH